MGVSPDSLVQYWLLNKISAIICCLHCRGRPSAMADGDGATVDLRTVFVKGVSFEWDDKTFEGTFSNIGPLRKCFLLKGAGKHHKVLYSILGGGN